VPSTAVSWQRLLTVEILQLHAFRFCLLSLPCRTRDCQPSTLPQLFSQQSRAVVYCRQPASTVISGIEPLWDPWPYICSVSRLLFFFSFVVPPLIKREGLGFFYNWCFLTTPYSTRGHIKVVDIYILYNIHKTQTDTKFYYIQGHLSMQDSPAAYASTYLNQRNGT
jgi:hypothetical protein